MHENRKLRSTVRGTSLEISQIARALRHSMTPAESALWKALQKRQLGALKFRRQHPLGRYILDFCCPQLKLAIEVDGPIHILQGKSDAARTQVLNDFGYHVLRFTNHQIFSEMPSVLKQIASTAQILQDLAVHSKFESIASPKPTDENERNTD